MTPLKLASHAGCAIIPKTDHPQINLDCWVPISVQHLGVGPASAAMKVSRGLHRVFRGPQDLEAARWWRFLFGHQDLNDLLVCIQLHLVYKLKLFPKHHYLPLFANLYCPSLLARPS